MGFLAFGPAKAVRADGAVARGLAFATGWIFLVGGVLWFGS